MKEVTGLAVFDSEYYKELRQRVIDEMDEDDGGLAIELMHRKYVLDSAFEYNEGNTKLMLHFVESMNKAIIDLYKKSWAVYEMTCKANKDAKVVIKGIAMPTYSNAHPKDIEEEEIVFDLLVERTFNPAIDLQHAIYLTADNGQEEMYNEQGILALEPLYCSKEDWLNGVQVPGLMNYWLEQTNYALYDILWVREYTFEIDIDVDGIRL